MTSTVNTPPQRVAAAVIRQRRRQSDPLWTGAAIRTSARLRLNPTWLHRDPCKYGADVGQTSRRQGWLIERGLSLFQLTASPPQFISGYLIGEPDES